jgi:hypothetical protein
MRDSQTSGSVKLTGDMLRFVGLVLSLAAAYFLTIQSLKVELATKAESMAVEELDKKLANIEVMLKEGVVSREQFYEFARDVEGRLSRIQFYLKEGRGEDLGKD